MLNSERSRVLLLEEEREEVVRTFGATREVVQEERVREDKVDSAISGLNQRCGIRKDVIRRREARGTEDEYSFERLAILAKGSEGSRAGRHTVEG